MGFMKEILFGDPPVHLHHLPPPPATPIGTSYEEVAFKRGTTFAQEVEYLTARIQGRNLRRKPVSGDIVKRVKNLPKVKENEERRKRRKGEDESPEPPGTQPELPGLEDY